MPDNITKILKAIADPTRREIFHALVMTASTLSITQIAGQFEMSRQGVTKHIKTLEGAGLVKIDTEGRERFCFADAKPLQQVNQWVKFYETFWGSALDDLGSYLDRKK